MLRLRPTPKKLNCVFFTIIAIFGIHFTTLGSVVSLEESVEDIQASIVDLQASDDTLAGAIGETQGQLDALSSSVDQRFNDVNQNISKLNSTLDFDETRIEDLEQNDQKQTEAIGNIEENIDTLRLVFKMLMRRPARVSQSVTRGSNF